MDRVVPTSESVIVLGAGISGLTIADGLSSRGHRVAVIDVYPEPGGNHLSWNVGPYTFDIGTIFFPEHSPVADLIPDLRSRWVQAKHTVERITPSGVVRAYPLSLSKELFARSPLYIAKVAAQIVREKLRFSAPTSVTQFVRYYIGDQLLRDSGLLLFMQRFYNLPPDEVGFALAKRRMAWIGAHAGLRVQLRKAAAKAGRLIRGRGAVPDQWFANSWHVRPRDGFAAMYRPAVARLQEKGVRFHLGAILHRVERTDAGFLVYTDAGVSSAARLVSTIPLDLIASLLGLPIVELPRSSSLMTLGLRFRGTRGFAAEVLYNFHREGAWKRLTMHSDFYGAVDGWEYLAVEITLPDEQVTPDVMFAQFRTMTAELGLFDGMLEMVASYVTKFAYPVYDQSSEEQRARALAQLDTLSIETVGRQGSFEYVPVASEAMDAARSHVERSETVVRRTSWTG